MAPSDLLPPFFGGLGFLLLAFLSRTSSLGALSLILRVRSGLSGNRHFWAGGRLGTALMTSATFVVAAGLGVWTAGESLVGTLFVGSLEVACDVTSNSAGGAEASRLTGEAGASVAETSGASILLEDAGRMAMNAAAATAARVAASGLVIVGVARPGFAGVGATAAALDGDGATAGVAAPPLGAAGAETLPASGLAGASGAAGGVRGAVAGGGA